MGRIIPDILVYLDTYFEEFLGSDLGHSVEACATKLFDICDRESIGEIVQSIFPAPTGISRLFDICDRVCNRDQLQSIFPTPIPDSRFPTPDSRFPIPDSRFPTPDSRLPTP
ncbi:MULTISPECIES: hypothetical protein [Moorena]|uniref:hypothetical protein n=1 Tax=Moorena TaxID=1155738 RepID=UPI00031B677F|nr:MULTISPECIES: hypothetical protein [Moorena]NEP67619.1 hypothetical protein [Moorena sp. SIO3A5]